MERDELHFNQFYVLTKKEVQRFLNSRIFDKLEKRSETVEDLLQEVFLCAWVKRHDFLKCENPTGWLIMVAKIKIKESRKREKKHSRDLPLEDYEAFLPGRTDPAYELAEIMEVLSRSVSERDMRIFVDYYFCGCSTKEIAARENVNENALRVRINRIKSRINRKNGKI